jgi:hypothetical protein
MSLGLLSADPVLLRELSALNSAVEYHKAQLGRNDSRLSRWLLGDPKPEVTSLYRFLSAENDNITSEAEAFDPSRLTPERITLLLHADFRTFEDLLAALGDRANAPTTGAVAADSAKEDSPLDSFIDALRPPPDVPRSSDIAPLRLYLISLRIRCLQGERRTRLREYIDNLAGGNEENLGLELRRCMADLARIASSSVAIHSVDGMSGPLPIRDPYPEERQFCEEMIARLESRALSIGKRPLVDAMSIERLRDRIERENVVRQRDREVHPPPPANPQRTAGQRKLELLVKGRVALRKFDDEARPVLAEFPELESWVKGLRRDLVEDLMDPQ